MPNVRRLRDVALAGLAVICFVLPESAQGRIIAQWVQLGPDGTSSAPGVMNMMMTERACAPSWKPIEAAAVS